MNNSEENIGGWTQSASAWIESQGEQGDMSRREILDPALSSILGDITGKVVLDVGCGEGRYARLLAERGAIVTGVDPVVEFIDEANKRNTSCTFLVAAAEDLPFPAASFDITLSYLSLVDILDYKTAIREMCRVTRPTGRIVVVSISNLNVTVEGWVTDENGNKLHRPIDNYMEERALELSWNGIQITNYHRPLSAVLGEFFKAGAVLDGFYEPLPDPSSPMYESEWRAPNFQIMTFRFP
jgi:SAM-dependent methyltransferase